jgi:phospholysine phosphohistidine inorganic pyrophosphate phosphatase
MEEIDMQGVLIDLDGVVYQDASLLPGAGATIDWLRQQGIPHLFLTNTTSKPRASLLEKLSRMGIEVPEDRLLTPPIAAANHLHRTSGGGSAALYVPPATAADFEGLPQGDASLAAVVVGDLGDQWTFARLNQAFRQLMDHPEAELIALGMTRYWRASEGLQLDVGPFVQALAFASGREPVVMGKPAAPFFQQACTLLQLPPEAVCMVGDDVRVDVLGAQALGIKGVLVKTGKYRPQDLDVGQPDLLIESFAELPAAWDRL